MPKTKISEFSSTPANNTDIDSINIAENCPPSGINDAIRELMAQLKDWQSGTSNDPYVVGSSGSLTLNQGTANGVPYLNGSKVVTSGSALTFDGTTLANTGNITAGTTSSGANLNAYASTYNSNGMVRLFGTDGNNKVEFGAASATTAFLTARAGVSMIFGANDAEGMRLTSTGLIVGGTAATNTSSGRGNITINGSSSAILSMGTGGTAKGYVYHSGSDMIINATTGTLALQANGNGALIDTSGNLGLGVTPSAWQTANRQVMQVGKSGSAGFIGYNTSSASITVGSNCYSTGSSESVWTYVDGSAASLYQAGGAVGHVWSTAPSGTAGNAITFTQALTLDSSQNLLIGTTTTTGNGAAFLPAGSGSGMLLRIARASEGTAHQFAVNSNVVGSIYTTASATTYNTSSDYRLKNITGALTGYKERLMSLQPKQGTWIADGSEFRGFVAHDFANPYPKSVVGEKDAVDAEGNPIYQGMQASSSEVMADLVAMVKDLITENASLKARLDAANL